MYPLDIVQPVPAPTIADMVSSDYRKAGVFSRFGIDFCCGGKKTVADACREKSLDFDTVERALMLLDAKPATSVHWNFADWDPAFLIDFIVNAHHDYVRAQLPKLLKFGEKVARTHGKTWPEVVEIDALVRTVGATLSTHMMKEEQVLFPYIKKLLAGPTPQAPFGSVDNPIRVMEAEHEEAGDIMRRIRALSNGYAPPEGACNTFRVWYAMLQEFEEDLHLHVHLENNILFPRAIALEHTEISRQV